MPVVESVGGLMREECRRAGLTPEQLADRAEITQSATSANEASLVTDDAVMPTAMSGPLGRRVRRHRRAITDIAAAHGACNVRVFGSVARGTELADSDIDLLVDLRPGTGLFALGRLRRELEELLEVTVDVVPAHGLKPEIRARVECELVAL